MNTEISAHDLHVYLALLAADKLEPENCISILTQVLEDDIDKTNRIASLLSTIRKASDDYNDLLKRYEDLQVLISTLSAFLFGTLFSELL